jgi:hypothetical protein
VKILFFRKTFPSGSASLEAGAATPKKFCWRLGVLGALSAMTEIISRPFGPGVFMSGSVGTGG